MKSVWQKKTEIKQREELLSEQVCDVAIIGAGMAGLLSAYLLSRENKKVIVVEADRIGSGQSGNTTAKITFQHGLIYHKLLMMNGKEQALQYLHANQDAINQYEEIIKALNIDCDFRRCASFLFSLHTDEDLIKEKQALEILGVKTTLHKECELPLAIQCALKLDEQACFDPVKFMKGLVDHSENLRIYEHTQILEVREHELIAQKGSIKAKHIVFATHFPIIDFPGFYFMRMHQERSYVLALKDAQKLEDMYYCIDKDTLSFRNDNDITLFGGENHRCGENSNGGRYESLKQKAKALYPDAEVIGEWSAQDCMSLDHIPYIGRYSDSKENWYVATGFNKWGMTSSMAAANIIKNMILEKENPYAKVFSPQRFNVAASIAAFWQQSKQSMKSISREYLTLPEATLNELPCSHGGVIMVSGQKAGVYKDEKGKCYVVDVKCPHLGCQLEWNPDELSWDCPCHGSRFDYHGKLIDKPAQENLYE